MNVDGDAIDAVNAAALNTKLLQLSSGAVYDENGEAKILHDEKLEALDTIVEEAQGESVLVFYAFRHELARLKARYPDAVDIKEPDAIARWKAGKIKMLLAHPASALFSSQSAANSEVFPISVSSLLVLLIIHPDSSQDS